MAAVAIDFGSLNTSANIRKDGREARKIASVPLGTQKRRGPVADILNGDGSVKLGTNGSFDLSGFRMEYSPNGAPRFAAIPAEAGGCTDWDDQFGLPNGLDGFVYAMAVIGSDLYLGGSFTGAGNVAANRLVKFNLATNTWSALRNGNGNGVNSDIYALAVVGTDLYVGGFFTSANVGGNGSTPEVAANRVAKFDTSANVWSPLSNGNGNGVNSDVRALAAMSGDLYIGGTFTSANIGGTGGTPVVTANRIAKFDTRKNTWSALSNGDGNGVSNDVRALTIMGTDLYVGGLFTSANIGGSGGTPAVIANRVARFDTTTNSWCALASGDGNGVSSDVYALTAIASDLYVGGGFTSVNTGGTGGTPVVTANRIAKFNTSNNIWSALSNGNGNGVNSLVNALAAMGEVLYVGGFFTSANVGGSSVTPAVSVNNIAKFDSTASKWSALSSGDGNGVSTNVRALTIVGSNVYVGGLFTSANVGGTGGRPLVTANRVAAFNNSNNTWSALSDGNGNGMNNFVRSLAVIGNDLYVGGIFTTAGNVAANRVAKFNTSTRTWTALGHSSGNGVNNDVYALAVIGSDLYAAGAFTIANFGSGGTPVVAANRIAKFDTTTSTWFALSNGNGNGVDSTVNALTVMGNDLYVGGFFTNANSGGTGSTPAVPANNIAKFDAVANTWSALRNGGGNGVSSNVKALAVMGSDLYAGGIFTTANVGGTGGTPTVTANGIAKFDTTARTWSALSHGNGNGVDGEVRALAVVSSAVYVGGSFTNANVGGSGETPTSRANNIARFDSATRVWSALGNGDGNGLNSTVNALAVMGGDLYVGGGFATANFGGSGATPAVPVNNIVKFDTVGVSWSELRNGTGNGVNGSVLALAIKDRDLYVGGAFTIAGGSASADLAGWIERILATPTITIGEPGTLCPGGTVTLTSSSESGNQWYFNNNPISGATHHTYDADAAGDYSVTVTASGCSSAPSAPLSVTANTPPVLTYQSQNVAFNGSININPANGPTDNVRISSMAVRSAGTYTGTLSVDGTTGTVSISNAQPAGTHIITIRATDNCGDSTDASFALTVNKSTQTITVGTHAPANAVYNSNFNVVGSSSSGLAVSYSSSGACTNVGAIFTMTSGAGVCLVKYDQPGDGNYIAAAQVLENVTAQKATSTTSLSSSSNPSVLGQDVIFTARVTSSAGTPTGAVQFRLDGIDSGSPVTLNGEGIAQLVTSSLTAATHIVSADFSGDSNFNPSTSTLSGGQIVNNRPLISFSLPHYEVNEISGFVTITVNRMGDLSVPVTVDYATDDTGASNLCSTLNSGLASARCDFGLILGTLAFGATETQKTFVVPITQDSYPGGPESFTVNLSNATGSGVSLVSPSSATVTINDSAAPAPNAIDDTSVFVRQQYRDFLNREPDPPGFAFWKDNIDQCNDPARRPAGMTLAHCIEVMRIDTSAAFFLSIEFQQTGNLVRSCYVASVNRPLTNNMPGLVEFERDTQAIQRGVIVGQGNWQQALIDNRDAFLKNFVTRAEFVGAYPLTDTPTQYVDKLYLHAGITPLPSERISAVGEFGSATIAADARARGRVLLDLTQNTAFQQREGNRSFVQMEYFGYLRRNANDAPDLNFAGYDFWLNKLNAAGGNYISSEMVKAFLSSAEYRLRFGP